jgi:hypothetical protein
MSDIPGTPRIEPGTPGIKHGGPSQPDDQGQQLPGAKPPLADLTEDAWLYRIPPWGRRLHTFCLVLLVVAACAFTFAGAFLLITLLAKIGVEHVDAKLLVLPGVLLIAFALIAGKSQIDRLFRRWLDK